MRAQGGVFGSVLAGGGRALRIGLLLLGALGLEISLEVDHRRSHARGATVAVVAAAEVAAVGTDRVCAGVQHRGPRLPLRRATAPAPAQGVGWVHRDARWVVLLI